MKNEMVKSSTSGLDLGFQPRQTCGKQTLSKQECILVSGGQFGTGAGGVFGPASFNAATRFSGGLGLLYGSFQVGWAVGSSLYRGYITYKYR